MPTRGRRPGPNATRARIIASARAELAAKGYERTSLRSIARAARVDQRLVTHFFGSKHGVFLAAMELPVDPAVFIAEVAGAGIDGLGERLARRWVRMWDSPDGHRLVGLLRAAITNEGAARMLRDGFVAIVLRQLVRTLALDRVDRRASFVASQLFGLAVIRYVLRIPPVSTMSADAIARWIGPTIQRYVAADLT